jgi:threonine/homoserine/homoserine lactone efflux protein
MFVLGTTFLLLAAVSMGLYAVAADRVKRMSGGLRSARVFNRISGAVLVSCGLFVASMKRA